MNNVNNETAADTIRGQVRERYGSIAREEQRGCGCAPSCCGGQQAGGASSPGSTALGYSAAELAALPEGADLGLGCGNPQAIAALQPGEVVVDLGSGGGIDCFLATEQVGETGRVIGVDMTPEMVSRARQAAAEAGIINVEFRLGEIEHLPLADACADVVISNCVINLSPDKQQVYREAYRVLKPGGRLALADVVALKPLPAELMQDVAALTGCISGAETEEGIRSMLEQAGFRGISFAYKAEFRDAVRSWAPELPLDELVASAYITAVR